MVYFLDEECNDCGKKLNVSEVVLQDSTNQMRIVFDD
jgi:hypothetical protein